MSSQRILAIVTAIAFLVAILAAAVALAIGSPGAAWVVAGAALGAGFLAYVAYLVTDAVVEAIRERA